MGMPLIAETESKSSGPYQVPIPLDSQRRLRHHWVAETLEIGLESIISPQLNAEDRLTCRVRR